MDIILRNITGQNWITFLLLGCLVVLATAKYFYGQQFIDVVRLSGADRFLVTRSKGSYFFQPIPLVLLAIQFIATSLLVYFLYCSLQDLSVRDHFLTYLYILLIYVLFESTRTIIERVMGYLMDIYKKMRPYFYKKITIKNWIGLFLLFGCFIASYVPGITSSVLYVFIGLAILIYIVYTFWLLSSYSELILSFPFYFILYFCALEIAPCFILYKYVTVL